VSLLHALASGTARLETLLDRSSVSLGTDTLSLVGHNSIY